MPCNLIDITNRNWASRFVVSRYCFIADFILTWLHFLVCFHLAVSSWSHMSISFFRVSLLFHWHFYFNLTYFLNILTSAYHHMLLWNMVVSLFYCIITPCYTGIFQCLNLYRVLVAGRRRTRAHGQAAVHCSWAWQGNWQVGAAPPRGHSTPRVATSAAADGRRSHGQIKLTCNAG